MRIDKNELYMEIAMLTASRTTCARRAVGCVLVDRRGRILSTGYNGVPAGAPHCNEGNPCPAANAPSGTQLGGCGAIHAEQNAILFLSDPFAVQTAYVTTFPCAECIKLLLGTSCQHIVYNNEYPHTDAVDWWTNAGRTMAKWDSPNEARKRLLKGV